MNNDIHKDDFRLFLILRTFTLLLSIYSEIVHLKYYGQQHLK